MARRRVVLYVTVLAVSAAAIAAVLQTGAHWFPAAAAGAAAAATPASAPATPDAVRFGALGRLLAQLLVIVVATQAGGRLARVFRQPAVVGEIAAGLALGPSLVGALWPDAYAALFPAGSLGALNLVSQIGVLLFMFGVGLDVDLGHLRRQAPTAIAVSHFSIVVPFLLGVTAALWLFPRHAPAGVPFHAFALFMGIALSITAFPVLARILEERGLTRTPLGATALACAAVDDVTAWIILALIVTLVTAGGVGATLLAMAAAIALFLAVATWVVRPWLARTLHADQTPLTPAGTTVVLTVLLAAALATEAIGIHALFGAFVAGAVMPPGEALRRALRERLLAVTSVFLLPAFFAYTGLRTSIGQLGGDATWLVGLAIIGLAVAGKIGGTALAARATGERWRDGLALGVLMNTRGLMELVALNVGYDLGILSPAMFTMLVVMALTTTAMTGPLIDRALGRDSAAAAAALAGAAARSDR